MNRKEIGVVEDLIKQKRALGFEPRGLRLPPKPGCRACQNRDKGPWTVTVVGRELDKEKIYLFTIITLCARCMRRRRAVVRPILDRLTEWFVSRN